MYERKIKTLKKTIMIFLFSSIFFLLFSALFLLVRYRDYSDRVINAVVGTISIGILLIFFLLNYDLNRFLNKYKMCIEKRMIRSIYEMLGITIYKVACDFLLFIAVFLKIYFGASDIFLFLILFQIILKQKVSHATYIKAM